MKCLRIVRPGWICGHFDVTWLVIEFVSNGQLERAGSPGTGDVDHGSADPTGNVPD